MDGSGWDVFAVYICRCTGSDTLAITSSDVALRWGMNKPIQKSRIVPIPPYAYTASSIWESWNLLGGVIVLRWCGVLTEVYRQQEASMIYVLFTSTDSPLQLLQPYGYFQLKIGRKARQAGKDPCDVLCPYQPKVEIITRTTTKCNGKMWGGQ